MVSDRMKDKYDCVANTKGFHEGQLVLFYNPKRKKGISPKLQTSWEGKEDSVQTFSMNFFHMCTCTFV